MGAYRLGDYAFYLGFLVNFGISVSDFKYCFKVLLFCLVEFRVTFMRMKGLWTSLGAISALHFLQTASLTNDFSMR